MLTPHELVKHKNHKMVLHNLLYIKGHNFSGTFYQGFMELSVDHEKFRWYTWTTLRITDLDRIWRERYTFRENVKLLQK